MASPHTHLRRRLRGTDRDRGSMTVWSIFLVLVGLLLGGVLADCGYAIGVKTDATDYAQQAARAGANQLDLTELRTHGRARIDPDKATTAAERFLDQHHITGTVTATPTDITVTVTQTRPTLFLHYFKIDSFTVTATAHAAPTTDT